MFQKIYQSSIFTSKLALRTWLIPIIFIVLHSYIILGFYMYRFESFSPPSALTALSPFVIFSMLAYLLFGVWIIRIENSSSMRELKLLIHNGYIAGFIGKCLIGILSILLGQLLIMIAYICMFYGQPIIDVTYYISVFKYITIFWSTSFFISFMLGMLLASLIKGKIIYPILLLIYCLLIPLNYVFLNYPLDKWLNLGEPNPHSLYHAFYGFSVDQVHFLKKVTLISGILFLFILYFIKKKVLYLGKQLYLVMAVILVSLTLSAIQISKDKQILTDDPTSLTSYYQSIEHSNKIQEQQIKLEDFDIILKPKQQLEAKVNFVVMNKGNEDINKLYLTLFHEFKVKKIEIKGATVSFNQSGDTVEIELNDTLPFGEKIDVAMEYRGLKTDLYFGNSRAIYLPNYFPWLPSTNTSSVFELVTNQKELHRVSHNYTEDINYHLTIDYNKKVYTNLNKQSEETWSGKSSSGLTVISGMLNEKKQSHYQWVYPVTWENSIRYFKDFEMYFDSLFSNITKNLSLDTEKPNRIFFFPNQNISDNLTGEGVWLHNQDLILGTRLFVSEDEEFFDMYFNTFFKANLAYEIVPAFTTKTSYYEKEQYEFNALFNMAYAQVLNKQMGISDETDTLSQFIDYQLPRNEQVNRVLTELSEFLSTKEAQDATHALYKEWFHLVQSKKGWEDLYELLTKYNQ